MVKDSTLRCLAIFILILGILDAPTISGILAIVSSCVFLCCTSSATLPSQATCIAAAAITGAVFAGINVLLQVGIGLLVNSTYCDSVAYWYEEEDPEDFCIPRQNAGLGIALHGLLIVLPLFICLVVFSCLLCSMPRLEMTHHRVQHVQYGRPVVVAPVVVPVVVASPVVPTVMATEIPPAKQSFRV